MSTITRPSRYFGAEINPYGKPGKEELSFLLAFPEVYEVGMSHYGFLLLYHMLKERDDYLVDRVFAPWVDMEKSLRDKGRSLTSREFSLPLKQFTLIGFSLAYELSLTNVLTILDLGGIPINSKDRKEGDPIVIAGGVLTANPEPLALFFDAIFIGEGEEGLFEVTERIKEMKRMKKPREEIMRALSHVEGVYIPSRYHPLYDGDGNFKGFEGIHENPIPVKKRTIPDLSAYPPPDLNIIPAMRTVHDRLGIEIARGCTRGCRFCQAGYYYRPFRERDAGNILDYLGKVAKGSGYDEAGFLSLSSSDYSCINDLVKGAMDLLEGDSISLSLPSLRVNSISEELVKELARVRKSGFTVAPEAGSETLRRKINKVMSDDEVLGAVEWIFKNGWRNVKMYFMIGLPGETDEDVEKIAQLAKKAGKIARKKGKRGKVTVSISTFVPKPHTPFQWSPQITKDMMWKKITLLKTLLGKGGNISLKWHSPDMSWLEGVMSRGDRKVGALVYKAYQAGARFDAWSDRMDISKWEAALESLSMDPGNYTGERELDGALPWDMVDSGILKKFLVREWEQFLAEETTVDCRVSSCPGCGVCTPGGLENIISAPPGKNEGTPSRDLVSSGESRFKYLLVYKKRGGAASQSALEIQSLMLRAFRKCGIPLAISEGFNPKPRVSFPSALPVGIASECEFLIMSLTKEIRPGDILGSLKEILPDELSPLALKPTGLKISSLFLEDEFFVSRRKNPFPPGLICADEEESIISVENSGGEIQITVSCPAAESSASKVRALISGCMEDAEEIKITKNSGKIFHVKGNERQQIYPDK